MSNIVAKDIQRQPAQEIAPVSDGNAIIQMIERVALNPSVDIDKMERLLQMQERIVARNSKAAFAQAFSAMQQELPVITERGAIRIGTGKPQMYALWEDINEAIKPALAKHGFGLSFRTGQTENKIIVTGVLSHAEGHSEETTMHLPLDTSGSKNNVQAVGSSISYGKRYTAAALLNLTSRGEDDDGIKAGAGETVSSDQIIELQKLLADKGAPKDKFLKYMKVESLAEISAANFETAANVIRNYKPPVKA